MTEDFCPDIVKRVNPEPEHDKRGLMTAIDEIVTGPVDSIHIERMSNGCYWIGIYRGEDRQTVVISSARDAKIIARTEWDDWAPEP